MQRRSTIAVAVILFAPTAVVAQSVEPISSPGESSSSRYFERRGLTVGVGVGIGGLQVEGQELRCETCRYHPMATDVGVHIGGMVGAQSALLLETQVGVQTIDQSESGAVRMIQASAMLVGQYWLTPRVWLKGGIGAATVANRFDNRSGGVKARMESVDSGLALLGSLGYEISASSRHSIDLQARLIAGSYDWLGQVRAVSVGVGLNWY